MPSLQIITENGSKRLSLTDFKKHDLLFNRLQSSIDYITYILYIKIMNGLESTVMSVRGFKDTNTNTIQCLSFM